MAKEKVFGAKIPKRILGVKLSKGARKDLRRLLERLAGPETRALALSAAGVLVAFVAEQIAEREDRTGKVAGKIASVARPR